MYKFSTRELLIPIAMAVLLIALGVVGPWLGIPLQLRWVFVIFSVISGTIIAPVMYLDRVLVSPTQISNGSGYWLMPPGKGFHYCEIQMVRPYTKKNGPMRRLMKVWEVHYLDGRIEDIVLGDLWRRHEDSIIPLLESYGVAFAGLPLDKIDRNQVDPDEADPDKVLVTPPATNGAHQSP